MTEGGAKTYGIPLMVPKLKSVEFSERRSTSAPQNCFPIGKSLFHRGERWYTNLMHFASERYSFSLDFDQLLGRRNRLGLNTLDTPLRESASSAPPVTVTAGE